VARRLFVVQDDLMFAQRVRRLPVADLSLARPKERYCARPYIKRGDHNHPNQTFLADSHAVAPATASSARHRLLRFRRRRDRPMPARNPGWCFGLRLLVPSGPVWLQPVERWSRDPSERLRSSWPHWSQRLRLDPTIPIRAPRFLLAV